MDESESRSKQQITYITYLLDSNVGLAVFAHISSFIKPKAVNLVAECKLHFSSKDKLKENDPNAITKISY